MDYLKIVLDGYCNPTDKKFLKEYFIRESKKAEAEFYSPEVFLTGCKDAVQTYLINDLHRQKSDARKELLEVRQWAKEHDQELFNRTYEQEDNLNIENYTVNLYYLTNGRYTGHMDYSEIMHISDTLDLLISIDNLIDAVKNIQPTTTTEPPAPIEQPVFTGSKLIDVYDPKKVHTEFKKELKCNYDIFKAWFVDSTICSKQMDWKYKKGNKTQLRCFIYVLCGGWEPAQTNTAFKIKVDSNTKQTQIDKFLLQRIIKCERK